jgi:hypothetical protein
LDTTALSNGAHALTSKAHDAAGNTGTSTAVNVTVNNVSPPADATPPTATIEEPNSGKIVAEEITVVVNASDNVGVTKVEFYVDGTLKDTDTTSPYSLKFDTRSLANGAHTLMAKAFDSAGNTGSSTTVDITTSNEVMQSSEDEDDHEVEDEDEHEDEHENEHEDEDEGDSDPAHNGYGYQELEHEDEEQAAEQDEDEDDSEDQDDEEDQEHHGRDVAAPVNNHESNSRHDEDSNDEQDD